MPNLVAIWDWKFNNVFTKPTISGEKTWKDDITPGMVKAYIRAVLTEKDHLHKQELKQLKRVLLQANDDAITHGTMRSTMHDQINEIFTRLGIN